MLETLNLGFVSYFIVALGFSLLAVLLLTCWRGRLNGVLFFAFCVVSAIWAFIAAYASQDEYPVSLAVIVSEFCRDLVWAICLIHLITILNADAQKTPLFQMAKKLAYGIPVFLALLVITLKIFDLTVPVLGYELRVLGQVLVGIVGLSLVEQIFRNIESEQRWALKFFCFGMGAFYAFDFYLYSDALLFSQMDYDLWFARPWVYLIALALVFIAVSRNPVLQTNINLSRAVIFYTTAVVLTGAYLLIMSAGGFYLKEFGGEWGRVASVSFVFSGLMFLIILLFSGHIRARLRVFIDKHFLDYKYDYREQWLGLIQELSSEEQGKKIEERALHAITEITDSPGGSLWVKNNQQQYAPIAQIGSHDLLGLKEKPDESLATFLVASQWVINLPQCYANPAFYEKLVLPEWLKNQKDAWLVVPLMLQTKLYGFIIITRPRAEKEFNWEDIDLLKTVGKQIAIHLAQQSATLALVEARQFEAFNRFSAYVVHDLKNLVSQLALVVKNAEKHKHNPAFMDDAIKTVDNAVERMNRLLAQLRAGTLENAVLEPVNLCAALRFAVEEKINGRPVPTINGEMAGLFVAADETRLISIIGHIVQNAQDATADDGEIIVSLKKNDHNALITFSDTGCGMTQQFIDERMFKPFDTTKGLTGMGIGAHESRAFVEELGGFFMVESDAGKGTTISITLPLVKAKEGDLSGQ